MAFQFSLTPLSQTSFQATVAGSQAGTQNTFYYQVLDNPSPPSSFSPGQAGFLGGDGSVTFSGLPANCHVLCWVVNALLVGGGTTTLGFVSLERPSTLLQAVKDKWYGTPALTSLITGGLWLSQVPDTSGTQRIDLPYAACDSDRTRFEWTETKLFYEITTLEFTVFVAGSAGGLEQMVSEVRAAFDWTTLSFSDGVTTSTYVQPLSFEYSAEPVRYRDDTIVYRACVRYEAWVNRTFSPYT